MELLEDALSVTNEPSDESRTWLRMAMDYCHEDNEVAAESGTRLMEKLFPQSGDRTRFYGSLLQTLAGKNFFTTSQGYIGFGLSSLRAGNVICVMLGGSPYALRSIESGEFLFIGECFLHGFMRGEAITEWKAGNLALNTFILM